MCEHEWLDPEEWVMCKKQMDQPTFEEFQMLVKSEEYLSVGIPMPIIQIVNVCEDFSRWEKEYSKLNLKKLFERDSENRFDYHGKLYRLLAFTLYGYGNWSIKAR